MFRNKEVRIGFAGMIILQIAVAFFIGIKYIMALPVVLIASFGSIGIFLWVNHARYRKIAGISEYLDRILSGTKSMNLPDNLEGEISILKNDIYKMVTAMENQKELLVKDRKYLVNSLSDISHQLKTPMTSMMVMMDLLMDEDLPVEKRKEFMLSIRRQLERMEWLLSSLLKLSKLDAGTIQMKKESVRLVNLIDKSVEHLRIPMELKDQTLNIQVSKDSEAECDYGWTAEAIANIVKNCMEHTPIGGKINIYSEDRGIYVNIIIEDTGEGIDEEDLPHIFERFYKGKNAGKDSVGIGLAMAKNIITAQNGRIEVQSRPGVGSRFLLRLYKQVV